MILFRVACPVFCSTGFPAGSQFRPMPSRWGWIFYANDAKTGIVVLLSGNSVFVNLFCMGFHSLVSQGSLGRRKRLRPMGSHPMGLDAPRSRTGDRSAGGEYSSERQSIFLSQFSYQINMYMAREAVIDFLLQTPLFQSRAAHRDVKYQDSGHGCD
jgi:hypothetical protein